MSDLILGKYYLYYIDALMKRYDKNLDKDRYYMRHHIVPKSCGGENTHRNLVPCTKRQHVILHKLLYRYNKKRDIAKMVVSVCNLAKEGVQEKIKEKSIGWHHSEESIQKMRGRKLTKEQKNHLRQCRLGKSNPHTISQNQKISKAKIGIPLTDKHKANVSVGLKSFYASEEGLLLRERMSKQRKGVNSGTAASGARAVRAINVYNGEVKEFGTVRECGLYFGFSKQAACTSVAKRIKKMLVSKRGNCSGWRFEYM